jgi:hypothetical protein
MLKLKHLRHPFRTAAIAKARIDGHLNIRRASGQIQRRYAADPRYDLDNVTLGFANRLAPENQEDSALLTRICTAYRKALEDQPFQSSIYHPTKWWQEVRTHCLGPVMRALQTGDLDTLRSIYRNFFRDRCSSGLVDLPYGAPKAWFGLSVDKRRRRYYLGDALHRIDTWAAQTSGDCTTRDLVGPNVGNPFGIILDGALIPTGATYQHYCAHRILRELAPGTAVVAEVGGGFGGMAYYLLRDRPRLTYLDFDLPESLALTAYYLQTAFPEKTFLLYGEEELSSEAIHKADVILMPLFEMPKLPTAGVDFSFSANAISDLASESMAEYLKILARCTRRSFLHIGSSEAAPKLSGEILRNQLPLRLAETHSSNWYTYRSRNAVEMESLYHVGA